MVVLVLQAVQVASHPVLVTRLVPVPVRRVLVNPHNRILQVF
jgi:hypothetical protein